MCIRDSAYTTAAAAATPSTDAEVPAAYNFGGTFTTGNEHRGGLGSR